MVVAHGPDANRVSAVARPRFLQNLFEARLLPEAVLAAALLTASGTAVANNVAGAWSAPAAWPLIAAHLVLTPDGRVLSYGTDGNGKQTGFFIYDIWDPSAGPGAGHVTLNNVTGTDIFCSSQVIMPQSGNIFLAGGDNFVNGATTNTGNNNTNVFNPLDGSLTRGNNLNRARWYSSSIVLQTGEVYVQGGSSGGDMPEVRDLSGAFRALTGVNTSSLQPLYPRNWVAPDGRVFGFDNAGRTYYITTAGTGSITLGVQLPGTTSWTSSAVMFRPGRILQMGGAASAAYQIDINGPQPLVTATQSMSSQRQWVTATVMADGRVLATGGSQVDNQLTGVNNTAEIWNPLTGTWTQGAVGTNARLYHSTAILLPDARVIIAGGGAPGPLVNLNAEIYTPPYLFDATGAFAARPTIVSAPDVIDIGSTFDVGYGNASGVSRVTMVKTGSITHSFNMDQRFIELPFTANGALLNVTAPTRAGDATPGYYLLFVIDAAGVPSVARMIKVNIAPQIVVPNDFTATIGGTGGGPFELACAADEAMVGIYGSTATHVNQVGPRCVRVDDNGRWLGTVTNRGTTGTAGTATYTKTCPTNFAISGFQGRSSQYVNALDFQCKALTANGKVTGTAQYLGAVGGTAGTAQGPFSCDTNNPVTSLYGRSGSWLDSFGMRCRQVPVVSQNDPPTLSGGASQLGTIGVALAVTFTGSDPDGDALAYSTTGLPAGLSIDPSSGQVSGTPTTLGTYASTIAVTDGVLSTTLNVTWTIAAPPQFTLDPLAPPEPGTTGSPVSYTASVRNASNPQFKWYFDDGTPETAYSPSPTTSHVFATPGVYYVSVTAIDDTGVAQTQTLVQTLYVTPTANRPTSSTSILYETRTSGNARVWVVNQDNDSVSVFDAVTRAKLREVVVGTAPRSIAVAPDGRVWVVNRGSATLSIINASTYAIAATVSLPFASQPYGLAFAPTGSFAFVALEGAGRLLKLNASTGAQVGNLAVGTNVRHVAVSGDGATVYASRFITRTLPGENTATIDTTSAGAEVLTVSTGSMTLLNTIVLAHSDEPDFETQGSGIPNYLGAPVIAPDGRSAWVPSKQDNVKRGALRSGANLNFQNTVRAIASKLDLTTGSADVNARLDLDNSSLASAAAFDKYGVYLFVALETSREVAIVDASGGWEIFRFNVGRAPQGLAVAPDGQTLYVNNFMDRTVGVYDLRALVNGGQSSVPLIATLNAVATEKLAATVLKGKQFFYDARDPRLARDRYMSCASCHNDGGQDGRVWDLTGMGEGLRNTIALSGRAAAQGFSHWSGNFDEIQDFEGQIRALAGGTGLMTDAQFNTGTRSTPLGTTKAGVSTDLDALAAYIASLTTFVNSPFRNTDGTLTTEATAGRTVFTTANCAQCHSGTAFTESGAATLRSIGTIKPTSGTRLGAALTGIDTPTLRDAWATAPYLHDGSAATIADAIRAHSGVSLSATDLARVSAYVNQIGAQETSAPAPIASGNGLTGRYFNNTTLSGTPVLTRNEAIDFTWNAAAPGTGVNADNFSVRWTGQIEAQTSGTYRFRTISDDGVRLTVNGVPLLNNWTDHGTTTDTSGNITLTAGQKYTITMEFYEKGGSAVARLQWRLPNTTAYVVVAKNRLYGN